MFNRKIPSVRKDNSGKWETTLLYGRTDLYLTIMLFCAETLSMNSFFLHLLNSYTCKISNQIFTYFFNFISKYFFMFILFQNFFLLPSLFFKSWKWICYVVTVKFTLLDVHDVIFVCYRFIKYFFFHIQTLFQKVHVPCLPIMKKHWVPFL